MGSEQDSKIWLKSHFRGGVSEMKCILFNQNNNNPYQICNNYIKLSIVFRPMQFCSRK